MKCACQLRQRQRQPTPTPPMPAWLPPAHYRHRKAGATTAPAASTTNLRSTLCLPTDLPTYRHRQRTSAHDLASEGLMVTAWAGTQPPASVGLYGYLPEYGSPGEFSDPPLRAWNQRQEPLPGTCTDVFSRLFASLQIASDSNSSRHVSEIRFRLVAPRGAGKRRF